MNKEELKNMKKSLFDTSMNFCSMTLHDTGAKKILDYINDLEEQNNKYKEVLDKIEEYVRNKNFLNLGYWVEDEEGRDVFIDVKNDILDIIKEER